MTEAFVESVLTALGCGPAPVDGGALYRLLAVPSFHATTCVELATGSVPTIRCSVLTEGTYDLWTASRTGGDALDDAIVGAMYQSLEWTRRIDDDTALRMARSATSLPAPAMDPADEAARDGVLLVLDVLDDRQIRLVATVVGTGRSPSLRAWVDFLFGLVETDAADALRPHLAAARSYL